MVILERTKDHQLTFLKLIFDSQDGKSILRLVHLGDTMHKTELTGEISGIKKWFSMISTRYDGKAYNICVVLRENGVTDFYYDFNWVSSESENLIEDIDFDFNYIYLRG